MSGDRLIGSVLLSIDVLFGRPRRIWLLVLIAVFMAIEWMFLSSNLGKFIEGGWLPFLVALLMFSVLSTWKRGTELVRARKDASPASRSDGHPVDLSALTRVPGTAVFFSSGGHGYPTSFLHNIKDNQVLHETVIFLTVDFLEQPRLPDSARLEIERTPRGPIRVVVRFGFREAVNLRKAFTLLRQRGLLVDYDQTSFFASKPVMVSVSRRGLFGWRRSLYAWLLQNSTGTARYFNLPPNRVIEVGTQIAV